jgi:TPR repeat protein
MNTADIKELSIELQTFTQKALQGDDEAWFDLGYCFHLYAKQYEAAQIYDKAFSCYNKAINYWVRAVQHGNIEAKNYLYQAHLCGQGVEKQDKIVLDIIESMENPCDNNIQQLFTDATQFWTQGQYTQSIDKLEQAAIQGYPKAQFFMYKIFSEDSENQKSMDLALYWLHKAAWRNDRQAQYVLGQFYHTKNNYSETVNWLLKAINQTDSKKYYYKARQQLSQYAEQQGQFIDILDKYAQNGDTRAIRFLADLYKEAKTHLEDMMALFAHKLRAPLQHIEYNVKNHNNPQQTLRDVESMQRFLNIYSFISSHGQQLQQKLLQDNHGKGRLIDVLKRSFIDAMIPLLSSGNRVKIKQHYLHYAKKNRLVPEKTKLKQWDSDYLQIGQQLQAQWFDEFYQLTESASFSAIQNWFNQHFFSIDIQGFDVDNIQFKPFSITEEVLVALLTEILLNMVKYYHASTVLFASLHWYCDDRMCTLTASNPSSVFEQKLDKGSQKGQDSVQTIVRKIGGDFRVISQGDSYQAILSIPATLLIH